MEKTCGCLTCRCRVIRDDLARFDVATDATRTGWALAGPVDTRFDLAAAGRRVRFAFNVATAATASPPSPCPHVVTGEGTSYCDLAETQPPPWCPNAVFVDNIAYCVLSEMREVPT